MRPTVGQILSCVWGYDRTIVDFYKVVRVSDSSVWVQKLAKKTASETGTGRYVVPTDEFADEKVIRRRWKKLDNSFAVKINANYAFPWNGRPEYES